MATPVYTMKVNGTLCAVPISPRLPIGGTLGSLANGPLVIGQRTQHNQQRGLVTLSRQVANKADFIMAAGDEVIIYKDGQPWHQGRATDPIEHAGAEGVVHDYQVTDMWGVLEDTFAYYGASVTPDFPSLSADGMAEWWAWSVIQWLGTVGAGLSGIVAFSAWPGSLVSYPLNRVPVNPGTVADQVRTLLRWYLSAGVRWDISGAVPKLQLQGRNDRVFTFAHGTPPLAERSLTAARHLHPDAVHFRFKVAGDYNTQPTQDMVGVEFTGRGKWPLGSAEHMPGTLTLFSEVNTSTQIYYAPGQAEFVYDTLTQDVWRGTLLLRASDCDSGIQPGDTINITGARAEYESMGAVVQSVTETPASGETLIQVGAVNFPDGQTIGQKFDDWTTGGAWKKWQFVPWDAR